MILDKDSYVIFDGAMGTMLQKYDLAPGSIEYNETGGH